MKNHPCLPVAAGHRVFSPRPKRPVPCASAAQIARACTTTSPSTVRVARCACAGACVRLARVGGRQQDVRRTVVRCGRHPSVVREVWKSIDAWGEKTSVKLVLASGGQHTFAFPSLVPITQSQMRNADLLDVYADGGKSGVNTRISARRT